MIAMNSELMETTIKIFVRVSLCQQLNLPSRFIMTTEEAEVYKKHGLLVSAEKGGLVLGNVDAVYVLHKCPAGYVLADYSLEPFQYVLNPYSSVAAADYDYAVNQPMPDKDLPFEFYELPDNITILDARQKQIDGTFYDAFLIIDKECIVFNKWLTKKTLVALEELNNTGNKEIENIKRAKLN